MTEQQPANHIERRKNSDDAQHERDFVRHQKRQSGASISHRQNSFEEISQRSSQQQRKHECFQRNLKHPFRDHEYLEWERRWQDSRNKNAEESVLLHPALYFVRPSMAVKIDLAALFRQQVNPDTSRERPKRRHRAVIRHPRRPLNGKIDHQRVCDKRQRKHRRIEESGDEQSGAAHRRDDRCQPVRHLQLIHVVDLPGKSADCSRVRSVALRDTGLQIAETYLVG
jgi:hypothetical protein